MVGEKLVQTCDALLLVSVAPYYPSPASAPTKVVLGETALQTNKMGTNLLIARQTKIACTRIYTLSQWSKKLKKKLH